LATQAKRDYYEILSVTRTATDQEIKSAFLKLAGEYQASGKPADIEAVERFREIARAYRVLSDANQRRQYDQGGESAVIANPPSGGFDLDEFEQRTDVGRHGLYTSPTADPVLMKILDKLTGWE
jgi:molecular chaperone DnaJ